MSSKDEIKLPEAMELLKEYRSLPELQISMVGKKYTEQVKFFKDMEKSYEEVSAAVKKIIEEYEKAFPKSEHETVVIKMPVMERPKSDTSVKKTEAKIPTAAIEAEVTPSYAIDWVKQTMEFIESSRRSFEQTKAEFNKRYDDVKQPPEGDVLPTWIALIHMLQHPEDVQNLMFVQKLRKDGATQWLSMLDHNADYLYLSQKVMNEAVSYFELEQNKLDPMNHVLDMTYSVIMKLYQKVMGNTLDDIQNGTDLRPQSETLMKIVEVYVKQKNLLEAYRYHIQRLNEHMLTLNYIYSRQQNIRDKVQTLFACMVKKVFFEKE